MKKILSLFAVALLLMGITMNASADVTGMDVSYEKKGTQLVATVTADGTIGGAVAELKFNASELSCTMDAVKITTSNEYVAYEYNVTNGVVCIGFVAIDAGKVPNGEVATITFDIAAGAQNKAADQFDIKFVEKDVVTLEELKKLTGVEDDKTPSQGGSGNGSGTTEEKVETEIVVLDTITIGDGTVEVKAQNEVGGVTAKIEDLEAAIESILTPEQLERVKAGAKAEIILEVQQENVEIPQEDKDSVNAEVLAQTDKIPNLKVGVYLDINLLVGIGGETAAKVGETSQPIKITIDIPEDLKGLGEKFYIVRVHEGESAFLNDLDDNKDTITFETDKFSTYAVVYETLNEVEDNETQDEDVTTDNTPQEEEPVDKKNNAVLFVIIGAVVVVGGGAAAFWFIKKKR